MTFSVMCVTFLVTLGGDAVTRVREGYLDHNAYARIGLVFEHYRWFSAFSWREDTAEGRPPRVVFEGVIDDAAAVADFYEDNKYAFRRAFKGIQLEPYYGLTKNKTKLRYRIDFAFDADGGFQVAAGRLGVCDAAGAWTEKALEPKSLLAILEGIYSNENPYVSLINGLPFK